MLRVVLRLLGYVVIAAGFVALVIDGAGSIANSALSVTSLGTTLTTLLHGRYGLIRPAVEHIHPMLWDPVFVGVLRAPTAFVALALGFLLLWLGQPARPVIGTLTRR